MSTHVNGLIQTKDGYAVKDFMNQDTKPIKIGGLHFANYETAVNKLADTLFPASFRPYLLSVQHLTPTIDIWNNLMFTGHAYGCYDHETKQFKSARQLNMHAAGNAETAYVDALDATYHSICKMVKQAE